MDTKTKLIFILLIFIQCKGVNETAKEEVLIAENNYYTGRTYNLKLFTDSTFLFIGKEHDYNTEKEKNEEYKGRYLINEDTISFFTLPFDFFGFRKALINENFLEFVNPRRPLKMRIIKSSINQKSNIDTSKFKDYAFFIYDSQFHRCFSGNEKPCDLNNNDLTKIDSLISLCIDQNLNKISLKSNDYFKQCIAVLNSKNEKEVWIQCVYKEYYLYSDFHFRIAEVKDGGDHYFRLKINLSTLKYYDLSVNGLA